MIIPTIDNPAQEIRPEETAIVGTLTSTINYKQVYETILALPSHVKTIIIARFEGVSPRESYNFSLVAEWAAYKRTNHWFSHQTWL